MRLERRKHAAQRPQTLRRTAAGGAFTTQAASVPTPTHRSFYRKPTHVRTMPLKAKGA